MEALEAISARHSTRSFLPDPLPRPLIERIVDAARLAATAENAQPWEFVAITDAATRRAIAALADYGRFLAEAPVCVAVFCRDSKYYLEDGSAATENLLVAAAALGVQSCWVAGDKKPYCEAVLEALGAPAGHRLVSLVALGREKDRAERAPKRALEDVLHWERWKR